MEPKEGITWLVPEQPCERMEQLGLGLGHGKKKWC